MEETNSVFSADGRKVILDDEDNLMLSLVSDNKTEDTFFFPYPSGGYGGGSLLLSPSERYLVFSYFSGESEDIYHVFGELNLFDMERRELHRHTIPVYPSEDWIEEETDAGPFRFSESCDGQFCVIVPWGRAVFNEPLEDILVVRSV